MADFSLKAETPLEGAALSFGGISIDEVAGRAIVSVAIPIDGQAALTAAVQPSFSVELPTVGSAASSDGILIMRLARDQFWMVFDCADDRASQKVHSALGEHGYLVDQSDGWALARVSGPRCRDALERICPLDLHRDEFPIGAIARTIMEHLAVIIHREDDDTFLLLSPRSSAGSFWHALDLSARNVT